MKVETSRLVANHELLIVVGVGTLVDSKTQVGTKQMVVAPTVDL